MTWQNICVCVVKWVTTYSFLFKKLTRCFILWLTSCPARSSLVLFYLVYPLQKDHRSCGGAEARHSRRRWKHTSGPELTLISSVAAAELRCTAQAFCQIYWLRAHNLVNMMLPLLTFPTPVNIVWYRLTSQGPSSANRSPFCCFDLAALFLTKCFHFCTFGNNLKHLNLRFAETFHRRKYSYVGGFVALLFPLGLEARTSLCLEDLFTY